MFKSNKNHTQTFRRSKAFEILTLKTKMVINRTLLRSDHNSSVFMRVLSAIFCIVFHFCCTFAKITLRFFHGWTSKQYFIIYCFQLFLSGTLQAIKCCKSYFGKL